MTRAQTYGDIQLQFPGGVFLGLRITGRVTPEAIVLVRRYLDLVEESLADTPEEPDAATE